MLCFTPIASITGIVATAYMHFYRGDKPWTDNDKALKAAVLHRWAGYVGLFIANATCMSGAINYVMKQIKQDKYLPILLLTLPLFLLIVAAFEIRHRLTSQEGVLNFGPAKTQVTMSIEKFEAEVKAGRNLVTIDNLVLDIGHYA